MHLPTPTCMKVMHEELEHATWSSVVSLGDSTVSRRVPFMLNSSNVRTAALQGGDTFNRCSSGDASQQALLQGRLR